MQQDIPEIEVIIANHLAGVADAPSTQYLNEWLAISSANRDRFEILKAIWQHRSSDPKALNKDEILERIWQKGHEDEGKKSTGKGLNFNFLSKLVAALVIFVLAPLLAFLFSRVQPERQQVEVYIIKENPASERSRFTLPDGSMVWLNSTSTLRYLENFSTNAREIELVGEAFFEVTKDSLRPFVVKSGDLSTTALGTSFNVTAYPERDMIEVSLVSGRVSIDNNVSHDQLMVLDPGMGMHYDRNTNVATQKMFDSDKVLGWKSGVLIFDGDNFLDFKWKLEHWYGVKINVHGNVPVDWQIRGRFDNEYLTSILDVISFNKNFHYQLNNKQLTLTFK